MLVIREGRCVGSNEDKRNSISFFVVGLEVSENSDGVVEGCLFMPMIEVGGDGGRRIMSCCVSGFGLSLACFSIGFLLVAICRFCACSL